MDDPKKKGQKALEQLRTLRTEVFLKQTEEEASSQSCVFHPESAFRLSWDLLLILLVVEQAIAVPFIVCFDVPLSTSMAKFDVASVFFFLFDIGKLISSRVLIAKNYLKLWFWLDAISSFPYSWITDGLNSSKYNNVAAAGNFLLYVRFLKFARMLRLLRLIKLKSLLVRIEDLLASNTLAYLFMLTRISVLIFFIAHWIACGFYYVSSLESDGQPQTTFDREMDTAEAYVTALYFAFTTMTTVGYGDITPNSTNERLTVTSVMIVSCCTFAYMLGSISSLVEKQNAEARVYRERVLTLNNYMKRHKVPADLQFRIRRFLEYVWENQSKDYIDDSAISSWLSDPLKDEIYAQVNGTILTRCQVFKDFDRNFVLYLSKLLKTESFAPGDIVFEEGSLGAKMYYVVKGSVDVYHSPTASSFKILTSRRFFGEIGLFSSMTRCASTRCLEFTDTLTLDRGDMMQLLQKYPEASELAMFISVRVNSGDLAALYIHCYICKGLGHVATRCRQVRVGFDHEDVRKRWLNARKTHTKYINPNIPPLPNHFRAGRRPVQVKYSSKNVVGVERDAERMFPNEPLIVPAVRSYLMYRERELHQTASTIELTTRSDNTVKRAPPNYAIFWKDSEESDAEHTEHPGDSSPKQLPQLPNFSSWQSTSPSTAASPGYNHFRTLAQAFYQPCPQQPESAQGLSYSYTFAKD